MFKLPFGAMPGHWGLAGKTREIAKAEYELEGYELDKKLLSLKEDELDPKDYNKRMIDLEFKYGRIDKQQQLRYLCNLIENEDQKALAILELDYKEAKITDTEYQKQSATLKGEPWVTVLNLGFGGKQSLEGSFELDWNEFFVESLKTSGYQGPTDDNIVNQWFMEVCRNVAMEEFDGTGDFTADSAANLETMKRWNSSEPLQGGRKGYN
jgi:hypothetical protein